MSNHHPKPKPTLFSLLTLSLGLLGLANSSLALASSNLSQHKLLTNSSPVKPALEFSFQQPEQAFTFCTALYNSFERNLDPYYQADYKDPQHPTFYYKVPKAQLGLDKEHSSFFSNRGLDPYSYQQLQEIILTNAQHFTQKLTTQGYKVDPNYLYFYELVFEDSNINITINNLPAQASIEDQELQFGNTFYYKLYSLTYYANLLLMGVNKGYLNSNPFKLNSTILNQEDGTLGCSFLGENLPAKKE